ncbi:MAG TPA: RelA/SpoT family protein, partial [Polyangiaceae bacterium]|nr:RelA/SpoT family protein [Polyangiaceae bacterium]
MAVSPSPELEALLANVKKSYPDADTAPIELAFEGVTTHLDATAKKRALHAANVLASLRLDPAAVGACLVATFRNQISQADTENQFGKEIAKLVDGVVRVQATRWDRLEQEAAESLRKMFIAMAAEVRVVIIVLALRVEKMRTLSNSMDESTRRRVARETLEVFAPLANRLGVWQFKTELENLSLAQLEPETYSELEKLLSERRQERMRLIQQAITLLRDKLPEQKIHATVQGRAKHLYSIYQKMQRKGVGLDQIHDISAVRVITEQVGDCYAALGLVHSLWAPLPGQFDDYIARPKENLYRSLHTTVVGPEGKPLEVQIRTRQMHEYAEYGVAAHWAYKEGRKAAKSSDQKFVVLRQLMDWERDVSDPHQFAERLKTDIFRDQVYVFTPAGDIVDLPQGATPLDFAYRIHTMVGHRFRGARVNDQIVPLDYQLKTGDRVEILTHKKPNPSRDWLNPASGTLRTTSARSKVRQW